MIKKLLLWTFLVLFPTLVHAQCNGIFQPGTVCGNNDVKARPPFQIPSSTNLTGPGSAAVGDLAIWNNLAATQLTNLTPGALTEANDTNVTLALGGTPSTALVHAASLTLGWTGQLAPSRGGTGLSAAVTGLLLGNGTTYTAYAGTTCTNQFVASLTASGVSTCASVDLTADVINNLPVANGGTGSGTASGALINLLPTPTRTGDVIFWNGSAWTLLAGNNSGTQLLQENSSGLPSWVTVTGTGTVTSITFNGGVNATTNPCTSSCTVTSDANYSGFAASNCTLVASVGSNLLTVALKDNAGNDPSATSPCNINYRSVTASTGTTISVPQTAALSISTFATGASLGSSNAKAFRLWVVAFNNALSNVLALINCSNATQIFPLNEGAVASSTAMSGSATSAGVFYTPNGTTVTNAAFRILGYVEYNSTGLVTAGTYATAPNFIQVFGPGIHKPGDRVQMVRASTTSAGSSTSATFVALSSGQTLAITPTSAANLIRAEVSSSMNQSATSEATAQISRGSVAATNLFGSQGEINSSQAIGTSIHMLGWDQPNTTSSTTYAIQGLTSAGTITIPRSGKSQEFNLEEIMG